MSPFFEYQREPDALTISLKDDWTFSNTKALNDALSDVRVDGARQITFQCGGLRNIDLAGAWLLFRRSQEFESEGRETQFLGFKAAHFKFLQNIVDIRSSAAAQAAGPTGSTENTNQLTRVLETIGRAADAR